VLTNQSAKFKRNWFGIVKKQHTKKELYINYQLDALTIIYS